MKSKFALAALAVLAAGSAAAQSNVTIFGRFNTSIERVKPEDGSATGQMVNNASRLGFRGVEDLGGGLKAGFVLEHGFNSDNGAQSQTAFWARQSELNLTSNSGMLRLGNFTSEAYYATADYISLHNHDTGNSADTLYAYVSRNTDKIAYRTPEIIGGLTVEAAASLKEAGDDYSYDAAANYNMGPLQLGAGWAKTGPSRQLAVRALYAMGPFVFGGYIQRDKDGWGEGLGNRNTFRLSGMYAVGASEFHANIGRAGSYGDLDDSSAVQYTLAYNYNLSKRTKLYTFYTRTDAKDGSAALYGDFSSLAAGIRHNF
jgi:predicted porin